ncbi:hypothetical protein K438DRAFT_1759267 [Mycena galopus ATCC 62051]|nr:hypothetical protein K438DRAFT_1759267 [Mycena galopus ATCC 62051]
MPSKARSLGPRLTDGGWTTLPHYVMILPPSLHRIVEREFGIMGSTASNPRSTTLGRNPMPQIVNSLDTKFYIKKKIGQRGNNYNRWVHGGNTLMHNHLHSVPPGFQKYCCNVSGIRGVFMHFVGTGFWIQAPEYSLDLLAEASAPQSVYFLPWAPIHHARRLSRPAAQEQEKNLARTSPSLTLNPNCKDPDTRTRHLAQALELAPKHKLHHPENEKACPTEI